MVRYITASETADSPRPVIILAPSGAPQRKLRDADIVSKSRGNWCFRPLVFVFCMMPAWLILIMSLLTNAVSVTWPAQLILSFAALGSLLILGDRPLLNPIQALVFAFHWWFAWGPAVCSVFYWATGDAEQCRGFLQSHSGALWVVALGLPLYAISAKFTLKILRGSPFGSGLKFLQPGSVLYSPKTLLLYAAVTASVWALLFVLSRFGLHAYRDIDYLGGRQTESPLLAALDSVMALGDFATMGLIGYMAARRARTNWRSLRLAAGLIILANVGLAFQSGSKGLIVLPLFAIAVSWFTYRQRAPWALFLCLAGLYVFVVEPFVASSRSEAVRAGLENSTERTELFSRQLQNFDWKAPDWRQINVESPFRGIYTRSVLVAEISQLASGPWGGESLANGFSAIVPRFLYPDKADSNMGNYFAVQLGLSEEGRSNIAITIPFEFVGNYGFAAGVASFALIGVFWSLFACLLLSEARLATHPLMPFCILLMLHIESSVGQFLNQVKALPFTFAAAAAIYWFSQRKRSA